MKTSNIFYNTLLVSVIIQIITLLLEIGTLFIRIKPSITIIKQLMILEIIVQLIEGLFYVWLLYNFSKNTTSHRNDISIGL